MSRHPMITRSKKSITNGTPSGDNNNDNNNDDTDDVDEYGNIKGLIDYECDEDFDKSLLDIELNRLRKRKNKKLTKKEDKNNISDIFLSYIIMNALSQTKPTKQEKRKKKKQKIKPSKSIKNLMETKKKQSKIDIEVNELSENDDDLDVELSDDENDDDELSDDENDDDELSELSDNEDDLDIELSDNENDDDGLDIELSEEDVEISEEDEEDIDIEVSEEEEDDSDIEFEELDQYDEEFIDIMDEDNEEENDEYDYFYHLDEIDKVIHLEQIKEIKQMNESNIPLRFKILKSDMDMKTKSIAIHNIDKLSEMDISSGEYCKMDKWINGLISIPFGKMIDLPINNSHSLEEKRNFLINSQKILNKAIFGHNEAKDHILQVLGKWIKNPQSQGNVLSIQGPMGNGKTTLVKDGIAKAINRPFAFIALGGASDSAFFDGHSYTYEGSHWGRIIDILINSKCMNPIIYFDELDKVSETYKGQEIIHLLTHLTDPTQNSLFQDNYFPGIHIDLSKALFIFSFNDETKVDRILKDRMYVIHTKGFKTNDKISISRDYLLPELLNTFTFKNEDILFPDNTLEYIIEKYTGKEEGVRNLKRCLETIISKINIYYLSYNAENKDTIHLTFQLKDFTLPITITRDIVDNLLKVKTDDSPPEHMYM